jgi:putative tricarboxylic transport membrane protein
VIVERVIKAAWTVAGLAIIWLAWKMGVGRLDEPGPGLMSVGLGALIAAIGLAQLVAGVTKGLSVEVDSKVEPWTRLGVMRVAGVVALLVIYVALFERVGFVVTTFVLLTVLFGALAGIRWLWAVVLAAALTAANYGLFKMLLGTQLPAGIFG